MEGQTGEAWVHPKTSDVLLDNKKHKKSKIHYLFYAGFKMLKESRYCRSGCGGVSCRSGCGGVSCRSGCAGVSCRSGCGGVVLQIRLW
jgi:hypothetical protein